jgi:hypothetical protein
VTLQLSAYAVAESGRWAATLSLDEPINEVLPWRWFCAAGWLSSAVMHAMDPALPQPAPAAVIPEPEATL